MTEAEVIGAFAAVAQSSRLRILRALVRAGPEGLPAGQIGEIVGATSSRLSFHLGRLEDAGLVASQRRARHVVYRPRFDTLTALVAYLAHDCCRSHPDVCASLATTSLSCCPEVADV